MTWNTAATPSYWCTDPGYAANGGATRYDGNLLLEGWPQTFHLNKAGADTYEVRDLTGTLVQTGSVSGTQVTLSPPVPLGWYRIYFHKTGASDPVYGDFSGIQSFSILKPDSRFPDPPFCTSPPTTDSIFGAQSGPGGTSGGNPFHNWSDSFADHAPRGIAMLGPWRFQIADASNPDAPAPSESPLTDLTKQQNDADWNDAWYRSFSPDSARPRPSFLQFPNGTYQGPAYTAGVTEVVAACYPQIEYFEGPQNEPDLAPADAATWTARIQAFHDAVKAGNPAAKVLGPCPVSIDGAMIDRWDALFAAGAGAYLDAISFHFYNCGANDIPLMRRTMDAFMALLTKYGLEGKELWQTEYGSTAVGSFGVSYYRDQAVEFLVKRFMLDQYGIPKEHDSWFYDGDHGFWDFPSMWKFNDGCTPLVALARVYSQEIWGKTWAAALDFGSPENNHFLGNKFTGTDGSATLALIACGRTDGQVTLQVTGASSLTVVGSFGAETSVACDSHGRLTVAVGIEPVYVRVAAGVTATVVPNLYGANMARWGATAVSAAGGTPTTRHRIFNGYLEAWRYQGSETNRIEFRDTNPLPADVIGTFERAHRIDTVIVYCPFPEGASCSLLDYDLAYQDTDGAWHTLQTITDTPTIVPAPQNINLGTAGFLDSFHDRRRIFVHEFTPVVVAAIKLHVRDATRGGSETDAVVAAVGVPETTPVICVREIEVYCRDTQIPRRVVR